MDTIIDSASKLFFALGYSTTSMDEIAAKIGVTKGTIYLYFKSKDEVLYEVCNRNMKMLQEMLKDVTVEQILDMGTTFFETEMKMPDHIKFHWIFALGEMNSNPQVRKILLDSYREYVDLLASKIEQLKTNGRIFENTDSLNLSRLLVAFHNGIMMSVMQGLPENLALSLFKVGMAALLQNPYKALG